MRSSTEIQNKRAVYAIGWTIILSIAMIFTGCTTFFQTKESETEANNTPEQESTLTPLRSLFQQAYDTRENPDSLRQAVHYLTEIIKRTGPDTLYRRQLQVKEAELKYLTATYTSLDADSSKILYEQGSEAAQAILKVHPVLYGFIFNNVIPQNLAVFKQVPYAVLDVVYWWSLNYLFWLRKEAPLARLVARAKIERAIRVIQSADPNYRWGAVSRLTGLMLLISPDGDLNHARKAFQQAIAREKDYLENRYFYGRYYGVLLQNRQVFRAQLDSTVGHNSVNTLPFTQLNALVKVKAAQSLSQESTYFFSINHSDILRGEIVPAD